MWLIIAAGFVLAFELNLSVKRQCSFVGFCEQAMNFGVSLKVGNSSISEVNILIYILAQLRGVD
jgi:hypothetical protein